MRRDSQRHLIAGIKEKDMVGQKRVVFPRYHQGPNRCSTLVLATSDKVLRGFLPCIRPVLALVQHLGVFREPPSSQIRCLQRYGMAETPNCPFFGHTGAVFSPCPTLLFPEVNRCLTNSIPSCAT